MCLYKCGHVPGKVVSFCGGTCQERIVSFCGGHVPKERECVILCIFRVSIVKKTHTFLHFLMPFSKSTRHFET